MFRGFRRFVPAATVVCRQTNGFRFTSSGSPVDVENFTLNEEIVKQHKAAAQRWQDVGEALTAFKEQKQYADLLQKITESKRLLEELGPDDSPVLCDVMLALEEAQAHYNLGNGAEALRACDQALSVLEAVEEKHRDPARIAEVKEMKGYILLQIGDYEKARETFDGLRNWIDKGCAGASPMLVAAAKGMRRTVMTGLGLCYQAEAEKSRDRALFDKALNILIEALNAHIEEKDSSAVKQTLEGALKCFIGLDDKKQAKETCEKYISWCRRHDDEEGVAHGEKILATL